MSNQESIKHGEDERVVEGDKRFRMDKSKLVIWLVVLMIAVFFWLLIVYLIGRFL